MAFVFTSGVCKADTSEFQNGDSRNFSNRRSGAEPDSCLSEDCRHGGPGCMIIDTVQGTNDPTLIYGMRISKDQYTTVNFYGRYNYVMGVPHEIHAYFSSNPGVDICATTGAYCSYNTGTHTFNGQLPLPDPCIKFTLTVVLKAICLATDYTYNTEPIELYVVSSNSNDCLPEPDESSQSCSGQGAGNPVNVVAGKMWYTHTDISMKGNVPLSFSRHYDNKSSYNFDMGYGWRNNFDLNLDLSTATQIKFYDERDHKITYAAVGDRDWTFHTKLSQPNGSSGYYQIDTFDGTKYQFNDIVSGTAAYLTKMVEANGDIYTITRDGSHRILSVTNTIGWGLDFAYSTGDNKIYRIITNPGGATIYFDYDANNNLKLYKDAEGQNWTYLYEDPNDVHNLTKVIDPSGHIIEQHTYDTFDRVATSSIDGGHEPLTFSYDNSTQTTVTNSKKATVYAINPLLKMVTSITGPGCACSGGESKSYIWSNQLLKLSETDGRGIVTKYDWYYVQDPAMPYGQYKPAGDLQKITEDSGGAAPRIATYSNYPDLAPNWDDPNRGLWKTMQESSVDNPGTGNYIMTTRNFDSYRELIATTVTGYVNHASESHTETWQYGPHSEVLRYQGPRTDVNYITTYIYYLDTAATLENRGQVYQIVNAKGHTTTYENYHFSGSAQKVTDPNFVIEESTFNNRGQITSETLHAESEQVTQYNYYNDGLLHYITHPEGNITEYIYNAQHRISEQREEPSLSTPIQRAYYEYDTEDIKTMERYDQWITGSGWSETKETDYTNDDYNRISHISYPTAPAQYTELRYDGNGNLQYYNDGNHLLSSTGTYVTYVYDNFNRKTQEKIINGGVPETTQYQYDTQNSITQVLIPA